ncbi:MAG: trypsin-like peptidase domain-containing protein [candidate division WOR-3 bacterium]
MTKQNIFKVLVILLIGIFLGGVVIPYFANAGILEDFFNISPKKSVQDIKIQENQNPYTAVSSEEEIVINVVKKSVPAVVSVVATKDVPQFERYFFNPFGDDPFFKDFFGNGFNFEIPQYRQKGTTRQRVSAGTGFIVSSDGLIVTNKHVVSDEKAEYTVILNDKRKFNAKILAKDPVQDIAILKIDAKDLPTLPLGNSDSIQIGQTAIAIGYALGEFTNTVSKGIISGLGRTVDAYSGFGQSETLRGVIQTDTAINPGNSGGPLLNLRGEVIGVNTAIASGAENIGFALPINEVIKDLNQLKNKGKIVYPFLGVRYAIIDEEIKNKNNLSVDYGALIIRGEKGELAVVPGSPADKAGLLENDIILELNGIKIDKDNTLAEIIARYRPGEEVTLKVLSKGREKNIKVTLGEKN